MADQCGCLIDQRYLFSLGIWDSSRLVRSLLCWQIGANKSAIASGSFRRLFNVTRPSDDALNALGVPEVFEPLDISTLMKADDPAYLNSGPICSQSVSKRLLQPSASLGRYVLQESRPRLV